MMVYLPSLIIETETLMIIQVVEIKSDFFMFFSFIQLPRVMRVVGFEPTNPYEKRV